MKMLKTLKKYVKDGVTKLICNLTMDYATFSPEYLKNVDELLIDIKNDIMFTKSFVQPYKVTLNGVTGWTIASTLDCTIIANVCYVQGIIGKDSGTIIGNYDLDIFPDGVRPKYPIRNWAPIVINGIEYKAHISIEPTNGILNLYFYDEVPAGDSIPINLAFPLTTDYIG